MQLLHYGSGFLALSQWLLLALLCRVHSRRALPGPLAGLAALGLLLTLSSIMAGALREPWHWLSGLGSVVLFVVALALNLANLRLRKDALRGLKLALNGLWRRSCDTPPALDELRPQMDRLRHVMNAQRLYAQPGLTLEALASRVEMQPYRLRRLINQTLHYRNVNQYLNQLRIAEVTRRLRHPDDAQRSIASLAREAGFVSLSSFNKAFVEIHAMTPSRFRDRIRPGSGGVGEA
jgi:AraC-like DNA-binding protein